MLCFSHQVAPVKDRYVVAVVGPWPLLSLLIGVAVGCIAIAAAAALLDHTGPIEALLEKAHSPKTNIFVYKKWRTPHHAHTCAQAITPTPARAHADTQVPVAGFVAGIGIFCVVSPFLETHGS